MTLLNKVKDLRIDCTAVLVQYNKPYHYAGPSRRRYPQHSSIWLEHYWLSPISYCGLAAVQYQTWVNLGKW